MDSRRLVLIVVVAVAFIVVLKVLDVPYMLRPLYVICPTCPTPEETPSTGAPPAPSPSPSQSVACEDAEYSACKGHCDIGYCTNDPFLNDGMGACYCHYGCEDADTGNCGGGICTTIDEVCVVKGDQSGCECKSEAATTTLPPPPSPVLIYCEEYTAEIGCGGLCPSGEICRPTPPGTCRCKPFCENSAPECDGVCLLENERCRQKGDGSGCECGEGTTTTLPSASPSPSPSPTQCYSADPASCRGICPPETECVLHEDDNYCYCSTLCEDANPPNCDGAYCSGDDVCRPNNMGTACVCRNMCNSDYLPYCTSGRCKDGKICLPVMTENGNTCECIEWIAVG